jgi:hypothetical protein
VQGWVGVVEDERLEWLHEVVVTFDDSTSVQQVSPGEMWTLPYEQLVETTAPPVVIRARGGLLRSLLHNPSQIERFVFDHWKVASPYQGQSWRTQSDSPSLRWYPNPGEGLTASYRQDTRPWPQSLVSMLWAMLWDGPPAIIRR